MLEARNLARRHTGGSGWLIDNVSLTISAGTRLVLLGPSGAGKSLLLRALAKLDPTERGEVLFQGQPIRHDAVPHFRAKVLYLHQRSALIADNVEAALQHPYTLKAHQHRRFDRSLAVELLGAFGRDETFLQKSVSDLSGGEIQITALIRAVQLDPTILLLDEPTAALDRESAVAVERLIGDWLDKDGSRAMIWVCHNLEQAQRVGRSMGRMEAGKLTVGNE